MQKFLSTILIVFIASLPSIAQKNNPKHDTTAYYMHNDYVMAFSESDARSLRLIIKADSGMYRIEDYYMDGKPKLLATSFSNEMNFEAGAQGMRTDFYPNGNKKRVIYYNKGNAFGDITTYYPNGNLYKIENYDVKPAYLKKCQDSTGKVLTDNGNGTWVAFNDKFSPDRLEGPVVNGKRNGEWKKYVYTAVYTIVYKDGSVISGEEFLQKGSVFTAVEQAPSFPGGDLNLVKFITKNLKYPKLARENNIQGTVRVSFVVEKDGTITNAKIESGQGSGMDEEAIRVVKLMPRWVPGMHDNTPVAVKFTVPVKFDLTGLK